jgi:signal peptidase I
VKILREVVLLGIAVVVVLVPGQMYVVKAFRIPSESMVPTLRVHDRVLTARFLLHFRDPQRGEIFVFHPNGEGSLVHASATASTQNYVKRVIGLPNEVIGSTQGRVYVCSHDRYPDDPKQPQGTPGCRFLDEPYTHAQPTLSLANPGTDLAPTVVQSGYYFMMGDNRTSSADSRAWGPVRRSQLIGRVFMTYWPVGRLAFW